MLCTLVTKRQQRANLRCVFLRIGTGRNLEWEYSKSVIINHVFGDEICTSWVDMNILFFNNTSLVSARVWHTRKPSLLSSTIPFKYDHSTHMKNASNTTSTAHDDTPCEIGRLQHSIETRNWRVLQNEKKGYLLFATYISTYLHIDIQLISIYPHIHLESSNQFPSQHDIKMISYLA